MNSPARVVEMLFIYSLLLLLKSCASERHSLFWNPSMTPELLGEGLVKHVKIGDFLDIMCPHTGLTGTVKPNATSVFDIYNVTSDEFHNCRVHENTRVFFKCDQPNQENKLTLKLKTFSPSPFGFLFNYCQDYYYIAVPRRANMTSCGKDTTRFKLSVACKKTTTTTTKKAATTTTTTTTTTSTPVISRLPVQQLDPDLDGGESSKIGDESGSRWIGGGKGRKTHPKVEAGNKKLGSAADDNESSESEPEKEALHHASPPGGGASSLVPSTLLLATVVTSSLLVLMTSLFATG